jgi:hypothetical protein
MKQANTRAQHRIQIDRLGSKERRRAAGRPAGVNLRAGALIHARRLSAGAGSKTRTAAAGPRRRRRRQGRDLRLDAAKIRSSFGPQQVGFRFFRGVPGNGDVEVILEG